MTLKKTLDIGQLAKDLATTPEENRALRENRPQAGADWWDQLTRLYEQVPNVEELRRRRKTFAGCEPFEL
ncbi:MAG TPA: hypothetical protein VKK31_15110 [Thermoanaerobaculia bacterium]|nr:hypothetical protein [Thermoanaerobaculia bacterium]